MGSEPYNGMARWYDAVFEPVLSGAKRLGADLYRPKPGSLVLDVGCGTGAQLALYRDCGCRLAGIEPSPAMAARAEQRLGPSARIHRCSAVAMPYADAAVDVLLCSMMLHELSEETRAAVIGEVRRVLAPGGVMIVLDYHPGPRTIPRGLLARPLIYAVEWMAGRDHFRHHLEFLEAGGVPAVAERYGLQVESGRVIKGGNFGLFLLKARA
jgi:ubiquinone/menaquinone biosynthesis C-methylase UbiE